MITSIKKVIRSDLDTVTKVIQRVIHCAPDTAIKVIHSNLDTSMEIQRLSHNDSDIDFQIISVIISSTFRYYCYLIN